MGQLDDTALPEMPPALALTIIAVINDRVAELATFDRGVRRNLLFLVLFVLELVSQDRYCKQRRCCGARLIEQDLAYRRSKLANRDDTPRHESADTFEAF